jgi:diaminopimelate decarboxylase
VFIISEQTLRDRHRMMKTAFQKRYPETTIAWSYKTNYLSAVNTIFRTEGSWAEVVSGFEYSIARDLGVPGNEIIFNGPLKTDDDLATAFRDKARVHADSIEEIERMADIARRMNRTVEIGIRVNTQLNYPPWSKFGFSYEDGQAKAAIKTVLETEHLRLAGLHLHAGTYITDTQVYTNAIESLIRLAMDLQSDPGFDLQYLDIGGGYASPNTLHAQFLPGEAVIPTFDQYAEAVTAPLLKYLPHLKKKLHLFIEPGRSVVDEGISMVTKVVCSKHLPDGSRAVIVDAGVNVLPTAYWYKHDMVALTSGSAPEEKLNILGGLCMNIDVLRTGVSLPALQQDDLLWVKNTGAYNFSQSMQFIFTRPNYVLISNGKVFCIRERESAEYVRAQERLPEHLCTAETRNSFLLNKKSSK